VTAISKGEGARFENSRRRGGGEPLGGKGVAPQKFVLTAESRGIKGIFRKGGGFGRGIRGDRNTLFRKKKNYERGVCGVTQSQLEREKEEREEK